MNNKDRDILFKITKGEHLQLKKLSRKDQQVYYLYLRLKQKFKDIITKPTIH